MFDNHAIYGYRHKQREKDMTYAIAKIQKDHLESIAQTCGNKMDTYPCGNMGLTPDSVTSTNEWKSDFVAKNKSFAELRAFNKWFIKSFKKEYLLERKARLAY